MKKIIIMCCIAAMGTRGYAQVTHDRHTTATVSSSRLSPSLQALSDKVKNMMAFIDNNKADEAFATYKTVIGGILGELDATEHKLEAAKGSKDEKFYADLMKKQGQMYSDIFILRDDLKGNRNKLSGYLDEFIKLSSSRF